HCRAEEKPAVRQNYVARRSAPPSAPEALRRASPKPAHIVSERRLEASAERLARGMTAMSVVRVIIGPQNDPPFTVDAIAVEDDTYNVLSAHPDFHVSRGSVKQALDTL